LEYIGSKTIETDGSLLSLIVYDTNRGMWVSLMRWKMSGHAVTITLPEMVYEQIRQAAERSHRPVEDVLAEAVAAAAPVMDTPPGTLRSALAHLGYLNDAALWQAAILLHQRGYDISDPEQLAPLA
jgi:hypothetical protein